MTHRTKVLGTLTLALAGIAYLAHRLSTSQEWQRFRSEDFWRSLAEVRLSYLALGVALIFGSYFFRSLRWQAFLHPNPAGSLGAIFEATLIGFSAVALLGRPGEVVRPWLIARKRGLALSSQLAAWTLERVFDSFIMAAILGAALVLFPPESVFAARRAEVIYYLQTTGIILCGMAVLLAVVLAELRFKPWSGTSFWHGLARCLPGRFQHFLQKSLDNFSAGLAGIDTVGSFLLCAVWSALVWITLLLAFWSVTRAFEPPLSDLDLGSIVVLMVATVAGSLAALPGISGGTQVAAVLALTGLFGIPLAHATSAAILLWVLSFMVVLVPGLPLAAREGLTWKRLRGLAKREF